MHPLEAKKQLGMEIVATYHSADAARKVAEEWNARFSEKRLAEADLLMFSTPDADAVTVVVSAFESFGSTKSRTDARRLIAQGSVQVNGEKITDPQAVLHLEPGQVLRLDKRHAVRIGSVQQKSAS